VGGTVGAVRNRVSADHGNAVTGDRQLVVGGRKPRAAAALLARIRASAQILFLTTVLPRAATGAHHGDQETIGVRGRRHARYRWGERLQHVVEAGPGNFIFTGAHRAPRDQRIRRQSDGLGCHTFEPDPMVVNLPELDKFAEPAAREYPHPAAPTRWQSLDFDEDLDVQRRPLKCTN
jgi:uncharacterized RmlC-like cupin family protein